MPASREGLIVQHGANRYLVQPIPTGEPLAPVDESQLWACTLRGRLRKGRREGVRAAVIGDRVLFVPSPGEERQGVIEELLPRRNQISRPAPSGGARRVLEQVVVANLDRLVVVASLALPPLNLRFVDRILAAARFQGVEAALVLNKSDLAEAADSEPWVRLYGGLGIPVVVCSVMDGRGLEDLAGQLRGRITAFVGLSGVGKSSLLTTLQPGLDLRVASVGEKSGHGRHTTTVSRLYPLDLGGYVADTPGMREFGLWGMVQRELGDTFVEMDELSADCRFRDCLHREDPGCAVREAAQEGRIAASRYASYLALLAELPTGEEWEGKR